LEYKLDAELMPYILLLNGASQGTMPARTERWYKNRNNNEYIRAGHEKLKLALKKFSDSLLLLTSSHTV
jgi:hypothetical protein